MEAAAGPDLTRRSRCSAGRRRRLAAVARAGWICAPLLAGLLAARLAGEEAGRWRWAASGARRRLGSPNRRLLHPAACASSPAASRSRCWWRWSWERSGQRSTSGAAWRSGWERRRPCCGRKSGRSSALYGLSVRGQPPAPAHRDDRRRHPDPPRLVRPRHRRRRQPAGGRRDRPSRRHRAPRRPRGPGTSAGRPPGRLPGSGWRCCSGKAP